MLKKIMTAIVIVLMFSSTIYAGDPEYILTHNGQDALVLGEIASIDDKALVISVSDNIVSEYTCRGGDPEKQIKPETAIIQSPNEYFLNRFKVGDYVLAALDKNSEDFSIAGLYRVDSLDYKTLKVEYEYLPAAAILTDFVNSGGINNNFTYDNGNVKRTDNGIETVIFSEETQAPTETKDVDGDMLVQGNEDVNPTESIGQITGAIQTDPQPYQNVGMNDTPDILGIVVIFGIGFILGMALVFLVIKKKKAKAG